MLKIFLITILLFVIIFVCFFFVGKVKPAEKITWGVNFSQKHAQSMGLDWKSTYLALIDDLGAKNLKVATYWDLLSPEENDYNFEDLSWQINTAKEKNVRILLVIGMKTPRWPECHIPEWAKKLSKQGQQEEILKLLEEIVIKYSQSDAIWAWQIENEPLYSFGECPWIDEKFLRQEIKTVRNSDPRNRPIIISDSGEWSFWLKVGQLGDIISPTLYRKVRMEKYDKIVSYPLPAISYWRRAVLLNFLSNKKVIIGELQAEPWCKHLLYNCTLSEQEKTMNLAEFRKNIKYATNTGLDGFYLWGGEWWYWLKEKQDIPELWNEARQLFTK